MVTKGDPNKHGMLWSREELILAFDLYCRIPFKVTKANNPAVRALAGLIHRTPASIARKLGNFGAFDPELHKRNISGLSHTSKLDRQVWDEFHNDWSGLVVKAQELRKDLIGATKATDVILPPTGPSEYVGTAKQRLHQSFFRQAILSSYESTCCVTALSIPECLIASHIIPWRADKKLRANPTNGLCLSATFDRLFDRGLMTVSDELKVVISVQVLQSTNQEVRRQVCKYHNKPIRKPGRFLPSPACLEWHRSNVFVNA
jgi:HNH endonuclease